MNPKSPFIVLKSIVLGFMTTIALGIFVDDAGDFLYRGIPLPYNTAVWGMGFGPFEFDFSNFLADFLIWAIIWIVLINAKVWFRRPTLIYLTIILLTLISAIFF